MSPKVHVVQGLLSGAVLYPIIGENAIVFGLAAILIDVDHVFEYVVDTRDFSLKGCSAYYIVLLKNVDKGFLGLSVFHTVEMYLILLLFTNWFPVLFYVLMGFLFHHFFDMLSLVRQGIPFARAFSVVEYFVRRKRHLTSIRQILSLENVDVEGIIGLDKLLTRWGITEQISTEASADR